MEDFNCREECFTKYMYFKTKHSLQCTNKYNKEIKVSQKGENE